MKSASGTRDVRPGGVGGRKVKVVLHGSRVQGRYVLFRTGGKSWMIHRMDRRRRRASSRCPQLIRPDARRHRAHARGRAWSYEMKWDGVRAVVYVDGGRARVMTRNDREVLAQYPELRALAESMGSTQAVLDGEIVAFDAQGRPSLRRLQQRMHVTKPRRSTSCASRAPIHYLMFDLLHLDGRSLLDEPLSERAKAAREPRAGRRNWSTPGDFVGVTAPTSWPRRRHRPRGRRGQAPRLEVPARASAATAGSR